MAHAERPVCHMGSNDRESDGIPGPGLPLGELLESGGLARLREFLHLARLHAHDFRKSLPSMQDDATKADGGS